MGKKNHSDKVNYYNASISSVNLELPFLPLAVIEEFGVHSADYCLP